MARIRTIKPEFFQHEELQDLGPIPMLVFAGLWGHCDSQGVFIWKPRTLKLGILPFMEFSMEDVLNTLWNAGQVMKLESQDGKFYGYIPTFLDHQRLNGKEVQDGEKYPSLSTLKLVDFNQGSNGEALEKQQGSNGEAVEQHPVAQERKGRERNKEGKGKELSAPAKKPSQPLDPFYHRVMKAMEEKKGEPFANYAQEGENTKKLLARVRTVEPDHTEEALRAILETYWKLTQTGDKFWKGQPFTPSRLLSHLEAVMAEAKRTTPSNEELDLVAQIYGGAG